MAVVWTKLWSSSDDGTVIKGVDLRNIQDDINAGTDGSSIQGIPVSAPTTADDGKALIYDDAVPEFTYGSLTGVPVGVYVPYGGVTAPAGWALCYGQDLDRTTFADLFAAIGTAYGVGDGSTTFNLPDMRGRRPLGADNMGGVSADRVTDAAADTIGGVGGTETKVISVANLPAHTHDSRWFTGTGSSAPSSGGDAEDSGTTEVTSSTGSGTPTDVMNPYQTGNYIIKTT